jgi:ubiquinone/menaquinone biosynthesis C-methylase UbiE
MDVLKSLDPGSNLSTNKLQLILGAWVMSSLVESKGKVSAANGHVEEDDYTKQSIYSLFYSLYRSMGMVRSDRGAEYELTFNTWGYEWPEAWGPNPNEPNDPQIFGQNAYTGLYQFDALKQYIAERDGRVHIVELGCGTGAGAHHVCKHILKNCTYECVDMQNAAIQTARRKFVPTLGGRLKATHADCTNLSNPDHSADIIAVCETHVTEVGGQVTAEDEKFFNSAYRILKPGGFLTWGNAIPDNTWQPCFDYLQSKGMKLIEVRDVTKYAVTARDKDTQRVDAYVEQCLDRFHGFKIPVLGGKRRLEAGQAMKNFYRNPGTRLYDDMATGADTYKVALLQKQG